VVDERYQQVRRAITYLSEQEDVNPDTIAGLVLEAQELEVLGADGQIMPEGDDDRIPSKDKPNAMEPGGSNS
jgi:hypothetical protein